MNKEHTNSVLDLLIVLVLAALVGALVNPFDWFMFSRVEMLVLAVFAACVAIFIALFWKEQAVDEREAVHMMFAGRVAFLIGTTLLTVGIVVQSLQHSLDAWLPVVLLAMVASKYAARIYAERRK